MFNYAIYVINLSLRLLGQSSTDAKVYYANFNSYLDKLQQKQEELISPFVLDVSIYYVALKFGLAFDNFQVMIDIDLPVLDEVYFENFEKLMKEMSFDSLKRFIKVLYENTFQAETPEDPGLGYVRKFTGTRFNNQIISNIVKKHTSTKQME